MLVLYLFFFRITLNFTCVTDCPVAHSSYGLTKKNQWILQMIVMLWSGTVLYNRMQTQKRVCIYRNIAQRSVCVMSYTDHMCFQPALYAKAASISCFALHSAQSSCVQSIHVAQLMIGNLDTYYYLPIS